jgi:hypothetical protein
MPDYAFCSRLRYLLACTLLLFALTPARAAPLPGALDPLSYSTTIDLDAGIATFAIHFDRTPEFFTVDEFNRLADQFQLWTDTVAINPFQSTYAGILGTGPLGTQMMVTMSDVPVSNLLNFVWPQLLTYPGPKDPAGWGSVEGQAGYTLAPDNTLSFDVPLALLHAPDGHFNYLFQIYRNGAWSGADYLGVSGEEYALCVPEPAHGAMFGAGMLLLAGASRRGRKQR